MNNLKLRKSVLIIGFSIPVLILACYVAYDFWSHEKEPEQAPSSNWSKLETPTFIDGWTDARDKEETNVQSEVIVNEEYRPFKSVSAIFQPSTPIAPKPEPTIRDESTAAKEITPAPLIKFQQSNLGQQPVADVEIEELELPVGTMIYARFLSPVYSSHKRSDRLVYADIIKPLVLNTRTILPRGTRFLGQIESISEDHARFSNEWLVIDPDGNKLRLTAMLQEHDYDEKAKRYGSLDGAPGLHMVRLSIDMEPDVHKGEVLFDEVIKPLAVQKAQSEILAGLALPSLDNPWSVDVAGKVDDGSESDENAYYIPAGVQFYLWTM